MRLLEQIGESKIGAGEIIVATSVHNEARILPEFLNHYRRLTDNERCSFLIIDDYSTDETSSLLSAQPDVTLYRPLKPMTFKTHNKKWISDLLDLHGDGKWCLTPDADEHLIYQDMETKPLRHLINEMERAKVSALPAIVLDMYDDRPLTDHEYKGTGLRKEFPLFDALGSYRARVYDRRYRRTKIIGGPRHRLFYAKVFERSRERYARYVHLDCNNFATPKEGFLYKLSVIAAKSGVSAKKRLRRLRDLPVFDGPTSLNFFNTPLLLWQKGWEWDMHGVRSYPPSIMHRKLAAVLHYHFARGFAHFQHVADMHPGYGPDAQNHYHLAISHDWSQINPACNISEKYVGSYSVFGETA